MNNSPLFVGNKIVLMPPDPEPDAEVEARWSQDASYLALIQREPARPLSASQILRKNRPDDKSTDRINFAIRLQESGKLVGFVEIKNILWTHRAAWIAIRIGDPADRHQGYGTEALSLAIRYAFYEFNLDHLIAMVYEYNFPARQFFTKAGFQMEVCQREALLRFGRRWDMLMMGLLRSEWETRGGQTDGG